jgi:hypothetical protein
MNSGLFSIARFTNRLKTPALMNTLRDRWRKLPMMLALALFTDDLPEV